jgi:hypothetical protein
MTDVTLREKRPRRNQGWMEMPCPREARWATTLTASAWAKGAVRVISEMCNAELPGASGASGPTWHISVSRLARRPHDRDVEHALRDFGLTGAEEDNHHPGNARHFFLVIDPAFRGLCECKTTEDVIVDPDGYEWTNPKEFDPEGCRGCEHARLLGARGKPCPIHGRADWQPDEDLRRLIEEEL